LWQRIASVPDPGHLRVSGVGAAKYITAFLFKARGAEADYIISKNLPSESLQLLPGARLRWRSKKQALWRECGAGRRFDLCCPQGSRRNKKGRIQKLKCIRPHFLAFTAD